MLRSGEGIYTRVSTCVRSMQAFVTFAVWCEQGSTISAHSTTVVPGVGPTVGRAVGDVVGDSDGLDVGELVARGVGPLEGHAEGERVEIALGAADEGRKQN